MIVITEKKKNRIKGELIYKEDGEEYKDANFELDRHGLELTNIIYDDNEMFIEFDDLEDLYLMNKNLKMEIEQ